MPDIEVTNGSRRTKGFRAAGGIVTVKPNETKVLRDADIAESIRTQCEAEGVKFAPVAEPENEPETEDDLDELRAEYEKRFEKPADKRWKASRLLDELTKAD